MVYIGASAGTHIATSSIEHIKFFDDNYLNLNEYEGLKIYNGIIICHYDASREKIFMKLKRTSKYKIETLTDDELLFFKNGVWEKF